MSHVWGLFSHPDREMQVINRENETISHHYTHHVLLMAAIPVICAFIGTTQIGWNFGDGTILKLSWFTGLALAVLFYGVMLAGVAVMGRVIWWMARNYPQRPSLAHCMVFAGYVATPLFLSGLVALYPLVWLCALVGTVALFYTGYLLYLGIPSFLNINKEDGLSFSSSTLAIGVNVSNAAFPHDSPLTIALFARYDGVASLSKSLLRRCATRAREPLYECSSCRNFEFLYLAWP